MPAAWLYDLCKLRVPHLFKERRPLLHCSNHMHPNHGLATHLPTRFNRVAVMSTTMHKDC
jgi:hypothetical protein